MKVGVLMGGDSSEREISLRSGKGVTENIDKSRFEVVPIIIDKDEDVFEKVKGIDFAFLALHGRFGEDGTVQSILHAMNIPYSGCGPMTSSICMDKDITKKILVSCGLNTAKWVIAVDKHNINFETVDKIGYPVFVKPNSGGSSVATTLVNNKEELIVAVEEALKFDTEVMIEEYVKGEEITCPIIDGKLYPIVAIRPKAEFFDYVSKYSADGAEEVIVELEEKLQKEVARLALGTYKALKCQVYARVDMIIKDGIPYILEVNTLPGMTSTSLFPKSVAGVNISYGKLITIIIDESLKIKR